MKKRIGLLVTVALILAMIAACAGPVANEEVPLPVSDAAVYLTNGGDKQVIASGGEVEVQSGGTLDVQSGATVTMAAAPVFTGGFNVNGGLSDFGSGSYVTADGDNDVGVAGDLEVKGVFINTGKLGAAVQSVAAEGAAGDTVTVTVQFNDAASTAIATVATVIAYMSDNADGSTLMSSAHDGGVAILTDGLLIEITADKVFYITSEADGDVDMVFTESGSKTAYLVIVLPDGSLSISDVITHTA